ncbi:hypothetical protein N205_07330 [Helicobacter pylori UM077]|nr:hypothetical protein N205_07330 [Helicobacter pylori UM077]EQL53640.1 hypothetical protein N404_06075 [Helicobacter pylori FD506]
MMGILLNGYDLKKGFGLKRNFIPIGCKSAWPLGYIQS